MKKKKQIKNLIILAVVTVGIVLGLWAMKSSLNPNSNASGKCQGGSFGIFNGNCYEMWPRSCGSGCCSEKVSMNKCKNYKYYPKKGGDCPGEGYVAGGIDVQGNATSCYLKNGKVCENIPDRCCNKEVSVSKCN
jgi:hypothetical protein